MKPTENVLTGWLLARAMQATTIDESMPPDRNAPSGTSDISRDRTASSTVSRTRRRASSIGRSASVGANDAW